MRDSHKYTDSVTDSHWEDLSQYGANSPFSPIHLHVDKSFAKPSQIWHVDSSFVRSELL